MNELQPSNTAPRPLAVRAPRALTQAPMHPVCLSGLREAGARDKALGPQIVERRDQEFVEGLLADLKAPARHGALLAAAPAAPGGVMRLFQPLQRVFNLVVLEAFCDMPGQPRLDARKIDSCGFVLRRVAGPRHLAWLKAGTRVFGWEAVDEQLDPAFDRRAPAVSLGHPALDALAPSQQKARCLGSARLATAAEPVGEDVQPLFVAPPEVCAAAGKTLLFGTLRVASGELTESPAAAPAFGSDAAEREALRLHLHPLLRQTPAAPLPLAGRSFSSEDAQAAARNAAGNLSRADFDQLADLQQLLKQLQSEFDAFGNSAAAAPLQTALMALQVETDVPASEGRRAGVDSSSAWTFLLAAKAVLLDAVPGARLTMPQRWSAVNAAQAQAVFDATLVCLQQQFARVLPAAGRFDAPGSGAAPHYVLRAFVRLKPEHPGCAGALVWSAYSEPFTIAPWFESSGAPAPVIPLPDLFDRAQLAKVKPNVAFALPPKLANLLNSNKSEDLMEGKSAPDSGLTLGWICSFSLPIITLCAFIVLHIFLMLLNLIFFWLPFLKICIPIPKAKE
jgi:hypothetical protein